MGEGRLRGSVKAAKVQLVNKKILGHVGLYVTAPAKWWYRALFVVICKENKVHGHLVIVQKRPRQGGLSCGAQER